MGDSGPHFLEFLCVPHSLLLSYTSHNTARCNKRVDSTEYRAPHKVAATIGGSGGRRKRVEVSSCRSAHVRRLFSNNLYLLK